MSEYTVSVIRPSDRRSMAMLDRLLEKEGIQRDKNLDYTIGLFDEDYQLAATGSCFGNTLRCMAVDSSRQGEGLLNQVVSHLMEYQYEQGNTHLFLYTKCSTALFFRDLGFYEIARVPDRVVFMENRKQGLEAFLMELKKETEAAAPGLSGEAAGAIVMNANPFTLGHRYLVEEASRRCSLLHIFVVSEDASLVPADVRMRLVKEGCAHIPGLVFHGTGSYMISNATFPSYFLKDEDTVIRSHAALDISVFKKIAAQLNISCRFVGEEPFSHVTKIYNEVMAAELHAAGMDCIVIPRKEAEGTAISASRVRSLIHEGRTEEIRNLVPESTYRFFLSAEGQAVAERIRNASGVVHY